MNSHAPTVSTGRGRLASRARIGPRRGLTVLAAVFASLITTAVASGTAHAAEFPAPWLSPQAMTVISGSTQHRYFDGAFEDDRYAVDLSDGCRRGTPVVAPFTGTVIRARAGARGRQVIVSADAARLYVGLAHLDSITVGEGQRVTQGQQVGTVGNSGPYAGNCPHLHMASWSSASSGAGMPITHLSGQAVRSGARIVGQSPIARDLGPNFNMSSPMWGARFSNTSGPAEIVWNFGQAGDVPVHGDWDRDGQGEPGVYRNGVWYLRRSNTSGAHDLTFPFGSPGDRPFLAQVDGDAALEPCLFRPSTAHWYCRLSLTGGASEFDFQFGNPGDLPAMGDWDSDGQDEPAIFRDGLWALRRSNTSGAADLTFQFGSRGDAPLLGQVDGDPDLEPCVWRTSTATVYCRFALNTGARNFEFALGLGRDVLLLGDIDSDPQSEPILGR